MKFEDLKLLPSILKALKDENYTEHTSIQAKSIPFVLKGEDVLGIAQTGTGKTAAFAIPILQLLSANRAYGKRRRIRSLIVTPTRELAIQIGESFKAYGKHTGLTSTVIFGGVNQNRQTAALRSGVDILIATPGRLLDLMNQGHITLNFVEIFVLDEADRMLDMGFIHDVKKMIAALPKQRQSLFFSATMPAEIVKLASTILNKPSKVTVTPVSSTVDIIKQSIYFVDKGNKNALLVEILSNPEIKTALIFTRTKYGADKVARMLQKKKIKAEAIHGDKSQNSRQRALTNFKAQTTRVLVATDIAARGIDIDELEYVINYEIPNIAETYVHRIGRTGRAGAKGTALSLCDAIEKEYLKDIEKLISKKISVIEDHSFPLIDNDPVKPPKQQPRKKNTGHQRPKQKQKPKQKENKKTVTNKKTTGNKKSKRRFGKPKTSR